jgi:hypothetical protein
VALGKNGWAYVLDRNHLGGLAASPFGSAALFRGTQSQVGEIINAGAWATVGGNTFVVAKGYVNATGQDCPTPPDGSVYDLVTIRLDPNAPTKMTTAWCASTGGLGSPSITTSDGTSDAMVWVAGAEGDGVLRAWDLTTGELLYASDPGALGPTRRFATPIAVRGRVLVAGDGALYAFGATVP